MYTSKELVKNILHKAIIPALDRINLGGRAAQELVLGTGIQESGLMYREQLLGGPAKGLWQMEPATFQDLWYRYVAKRKELREPLLKMLGDTAPTSEALISNDMFAAAMCRILYRRIPVELPDAGDIIAQAAYWKQYYNTPLGAGKKKEFIAKWNAFVDDNTFDPSNIA